MLSWYIRLPCMGANEGAETIRPWQSGDVRKYAAWFLTGAVALTLVLLSILN